MKAWVLIFGVIFISLLIIASIKSYKRKRTADEFMLAGSNIGAILGILTFAAALFSAFTFLGMPDFFRVHGIGSWFFLAISDSFMVFFIIWFSYHIRKKAKKHQFKGVAGMMVSIFGNKFVGYLVFANAFVFLIPYVAIQIRGVSIFLEATFPGFLAPWGWASAIIVIMLIYSEIGGLKAIIFSDAIQGLLLLVVIWIIGITSVAYFGDLSSMFAKVEEVNKELLSVPGPKGLFTWQFLIGTVIAIMMIPVSQPQFASRIVIMKDLKSAHKMAVAIGAFAIVVIMPTIFIGMYGAIKYPGAETKDFLSGALLFDQVAPVGALAVIGLLAACLSTTNAQLFALGSEIRSLLRGDEKKVMVKTKIALFIFAMIALAFSLISGDELALLARVSFTGTSMMAPIIVGGIISKKKPGKELIILSLLAFAVLLASLFNIIPGKLMSLQVDIFLYLFLTIGVMISYFVRKSTAKKEK
jgi:SSS family solute:Na+ symporter